MSQAIFGKTLRVIIADPDDSSRAARTQFVRGLGHEVVAECATPEDLAQQCNDLTPRPSLVITSDTMPNLAELAALVRRLKEDRRPIPFLILSDQQSQQETRDAAVPGYTSVLQNPVTDQQLVTGIIFARASFEEFQKRTQELEQTQQRLEQTKAIEQAKSILSTKFSCDDREAYERLRELARSRNFTIGTMAERLLEANSFFYPKKKPEKP